MKITLNQQECTLVKTALVSLAKANNIGEADMGVLLMLSQKFNYVEELKKEIKEEAKNG